MTNGLRVCFVESHWIQICYSEDFTETIHQIIVFINPFEGTDQLTLKSEVWGGSDGDVPLLFQTLFDQGNFFGIIHVIGQQNDSIVFIVEKSGNSFVDTSEIIISFIELYSDLISRIADPRPRTARNWTVGSQLIAISTDFVVKSE